MSEIKAPRESRTRHLPVDRFRITAAHFPDVLIALRRVARFESPAFWCGFRHPSVALSAGRGRWAGTNGKPAPQTTRATACLVSGRINFERPTRGFSGRTFCVHANETTRSKRSDHAPPSETPFRGVEVPQSRSPGRRSVHRNANGASQRNVVMRQCVESLSANQSPPSQCRHLAIHGQAASTSVLSGTR